MAKKIILGVTLLFFAIAILIFRPVPIVTEDRALSEAGIVTAVYEGGTNDVVFRLENNDRRFYINRGLENGLELDDLRKRLIGNEIVLKYPKYWTPLDWDDQVKHVSKLEFRGEVLFNELRPSS